MNSNYILLIAIIILLVIVLFQNVTYWNYVANQNTRIEELEYIANEQLIAIGDIYQVSVDQNREYVPFVK